MKSVIAVVISVGIALPFAAFAQSKDVDYCNKLSATYRSTVHGKRDTPGPDP